MFSVALRYGGEIVGAESAVLIQIFSVCVLFVTLGLDNLFLGEVLNSRAKRVLIVPGFLRVRFIGFVLFCILILPLLLSFLVRFDVGALFFIFVVFYGFLYLVQTDDLYLVARRKTYIISIGRIGVYLFLFPVNIVTGKQIGRAHV